MSATSDQDLERWRALVERGLKGAPFDSLVAETLEGLEIQPLYTERDRPAEEGIPWAPRSPRLVGPVLRRADAARIEASRARGASFVWLEDPITEIPVLPRIEGVEVLVLGAQVPASASSHVRSVSGVAVIRAEAIAAAIEAGRPGLGVNAHFFRSIGASAVDELALSLAYWTRALRELESHGLDLDACSGATTFAVAIGTDFFLEIAKVRALRRLVHRVSEVCGVTARPFIAARTSDREISALDAPNNILRGTISVSAALIGGADAVACDEGAALTERLARNLPLVLALESSLGEVADAAFGSFYVEALTDALTKTAWERFREIEVQGGYRPAALGPLLDRTRVARRTAIATRRKAIVGVSRFPQREPAPELDAHGSLHESGAFEQLRARAEGHVSRVITVGACPPARVDFAREILAISGLPDTVHAFTDDAAAALGDASIVILAGPDAALAVEIPAVARALKSAGAKAIGVAGKPGAHEQALRDAGVDAFVFVGADVVTFAETLLERAKGAASS